jgi:phosphoglycolate phosphatase-like HAD superfamily hydrolase
VPLFLRRRVQVTPPHGWLDGFAAVRPVLETGWEAVPIVHLLATGHAADAVLADLHPTLKAQALAELGFDEAEVKAAFRAARDGMIATDVEAWLDLHGFYTTAVEAARQLLDRGAVVYVITTKAKDFAEKLLGKCGLAIPSDRVFGLGSGPKPAVLTGLLTKHGGRCLFVEDRVKTLLAVEADPTVSRGVDLLLADWGYNTVADRQLARDHGIKVSSQAEVMGAWGADPQQ